MPEPNELTLWNTVARMSAASFVMLGILAIAVQLALIAGPLKWLQLRRLRRADQAFWIALGTTRSGEQLSVVAQTHPDSPCGRVLGAMTLAAREQASYEELLGVARQAIAREQDVCDRLMPALATTAATAPLMGLFGTVWGLIEAFLTISVAKSSQLHVIAPAMSGALLTTALGLMAAMPASIAHNFAGARAQTLIDDLEAAAQLWAGRLSSGGSR